MKGVTLFAAVLLIAFAAQAVASELAYTCVVEHVYDFDATFGVKKTSELKSSVWEEQFRNSSFSVSRLSGEIIGEVIPTSKATSTKVIHEGSSKYSFKTVAYFKDQVQVLEVQEYVDGVEKPFIALSMGGAGVVTGICR